MVEQEKSQEPNPLRAALYVDGFNLYHPIHRMGGEWSHLKWASLWRLGENLVRPQQQELVKVLFCTAVPSIRQDMGKRQRHEQFNDAQRACGVTVINGHYVPEDIEDNGVPTGHKKWTEKQTDINVALELIMDGLDDIYDVALLLSADTDQVATARVFAERLAPLGKRFVGVAPPDRKAPAGYSEFNIRSVTLKREDIEQCVMQETLQYGGRQITRPPEYAPPDNWMHPDDRPKGKPPKVPKGTVWR